jgi:hypothetical protein
VTTEIGILRTISESPKPNRRADSKIALEILQILQESTVTATSEETPS